MARLPAYGILAAVAVGGYGLGNAMAGAIVGDPRHANYLMWNQSSIIKGTKPFDREDV